jgi:hypothetical protein
MASVRHGWNDAMSEPIVSLSNIDDNIAIEKGRLLAAKALADNPEQRKRFEERFGIEYARHRYPEVYAPSPHRVRIIDKIEWLNWGMFGGSR